MYRCHSEAVRTVRIHLTGSFTESHTGVGVTCVQSLVASMSLPLVPRSIWSVEKLLWCELGVCMYSTEAPLLTERGSLCSHLVTLPSHMTRNK